jgi:hypothetical protein
MSLPFPLLPLVVCMLAAMVVGMLWFSPMLFATPWMKLTGITPAKMKKGAGAEAYLVSLATGLLMAFALWTIYFLAGISDVVTMLSIAFVVWLAFNGLPMLNHSMFDQRPKQLVAIYAGYDLTNALVMALILSLWR